MESWQKPLTYYDMNGNEIDQSAFGVDGYETQQEVSKDLSKDGVFGVRAVILIGQNEGSTYQVSSDEPFAFTVGNVNGVDFSLDDENLQDGMKVNISCFQFGSYVTNYSDKRIKASNDCADLVTVYPDERLFARDNFVLRLSEECVLAVYRRYSDLGRSAD